ncbi:heme ABC exporter ATP-binding protein CcmA [Limibacillus halophilus]|uniref:Heme exporter protein A n=1 Tax=Limibacillus halophilus TaxID=1579333 RepID=A0A839SWH5_9PROT|nr:heme ABC exporter ATP-binding protein CcmA [Limibacillus halophilus]MBB3066389.1 heme exporter protein A [Limibacillus halophilus]
MALFEGHNLVCERGERLVFAGLDFAVDPGDALLLTGPNGSGKSSLLRLMAGLLKPVAGDLRWEGRDLRTHRDGFLENLQYLGHLEAVKAVLDLRENLRFWAGLRGVDLSDTALYTTLRAFGLEDLADLPAGYLSAGQKRRLALSRLLVGEARLWLLDEPTVGLDQASVASLVTQVEKHRSEGGCVIAATHLDLGLSAPRHLALDRIGGVGAA